MNPYGIIIALFTLAGLVMAAWGWIVITRGRKTLHWPSVDGVIEQARMASEENDTLPKIVFSYKVGDHRYRCDAKLPGDVALAPDLAESQVKKYPPGSTVRVHYNPKEPAQAILEPGPARDDWLIFSIGLAAMVLGLCFLIFK